MFRSLLYWFWLFYFQCLLFSLYFSVFSCHFTFSVFSSSSSAVCFLCFVPFFPLVFLFLFFLSLLFIFFFFFLLFSFPFPSFFSFFPSSLCFFASRCSHIQSNAKIYFCIHTCNNALHLLITVCKIYSTVQCKCKIAVVKFVLFFCVSLSSL